MDSKDTNPKDLVGSTKLPLSAVPDTLDVFAAPAFLEGALKYGRYNWRYAGVRASIYIDAHKRHVAKYWNGQDCDPVTRVHHLSSAIACLAIILDAELCGKLTDDRPPKNEGLSSKIDELTTLVEHLKTLFRDHAPHQYTIADDEPPRTFIDLRDIRWTEPELQKMTVTCTEPLMLHEISNAEPKYIPAWMAKSGAMYDTKTGDCVSCSD